MFHFIGLYWRHWRGSALCQCQKPSYGSFFSLPHSTPWNLTATFIAKIQTTRSWGGGFNPYHMEWNHMLLGQIPRPLVLSSCDARSYLDLVLLVYAYVLCNLGMLPFPLSLLEIGHQENKLICNTTVCWKRRCVEHSSQIW